MTADRGETGHGACAAVIFYATDVLIREEGKYLRHCTNKFAAYNVLVLALAASRPLGAIELKVFSDSELLVRQFSGEYKVKDPTLKVLMAEIRKKSAAFKRVTLSHVRREANSHADRLVNVILDNAGTKTAPGLAPHFFRSGQSAGLARSVAKENAQKLHQPRLF